MGDNAGLMSASASSALRLSSSSAVAALRARTALAQDKDADNKAAAKEHSSRGTSYYDLGRYDEAIKEFEAAYQLKNDPAFLFNLAQSYRLAGNARAGAALLQDLPALRAEGAQPRRHRGEDQGAGAAGRAAGGRNDAAAHHDHPAAGHDDAAPGTTPPPPDTQLGTVADAARRAAARRRRAPPGYTPPATDAAVDPGRKFRIAGLATAGAGGMIT